MTYYPNIQKFNNMIDKSLTILDEIPQPIGTSKNIDYTADSNYNHILPKCHLSLTVHIFASVGTPLASVCVYSPR